MFNVLLMNYLYFFGFLSADSSTSGDIEKILSVSFTALQIVPLLILIFLTNTYLISFPNPTRSVVIGKFAVFVVSILLVGTVSFVTFVLGDSCSEKLTDGFACAFYRMVFLPLKYILAITFFFVSDHILKRYKQCVA